MTVPEQGLIPMASKFQTPLQKRGFSGEYQAESSWESSLGLTKAAMLKLPFWGSNNRIFECVCMGWGCCFVLFLIYLLVKTVSHSVAQTALETNFPNLPNP